MKKPSRRTTLALAGAAGAAAVAGLVAYRARRRRTVVRAADRPPHALLAPPTLDPDIVDLTTDDGAHLHIRAYGDPDADPIVLSHGWTCNADYWIPQINALAGRYRVITYDQRGHGRSDLGTRTFGPDVLADDLAAVLAATVPAGRRAVLAGHSMGGMSIIAWAGRHPEQVREKASGVLLASTGTDSLLAEAALLPPRLGRVPEPVARRVLGAAVPLVASPLTTRALKYVALAPGSSTAEVEFCEKIVLGCTPRARGNWGTALSAIDIRTGLEHLTVPTTVLVGTADRLTPPVHAHRLAEALEAAGHLEHFVVLDGIGHMSSVEAIDAFDDELLYLAEREPVQATA
ncbi:MULTISPECIES: alpha/beta fold hydrolase [Rhodococcus]|uniref:alpha/beta fold hydrolase n=1 Tax=Rhodococcus TaxID=1827 RepID=UPI000EBE8551|nr:MULTISPECIES: alpha/beta hydrolase [Rhodococcus]RIK13436.1 MAG: alpha/beta hydrolase [Acidobacteriota bacterium]MCZ1071039.1 alpha/beta hydrolase [Rhodococcus sp. A5(2022)]MDO1479234.1 alpha/beta hydrolase [Rhodococcus ruber]QRE82350.1 alpha/beta hydrolase [Rhodococcus ruber]WML61583.1 alpha/beta hydrolase [Rhodococcus sp. AH-ZY2]